MTEAGTENSAPAGRAEGRRLARDLAAARAALQMAEATRFNVAEMAKEIGWGVGAALAALDGGSGSPDERAEMARFVLYALMDHAARIEREVGESSH